MWSSILEDCTILCRLIYQSSPTAEGFKCFLLGLVWRIEAKKNLQKSRKNEFTFGRISTDPSISSHQKMSWICSVSSGLISSWLLMSVHLVAHLTTMQNLLWIVRIAGQNDQKTSGSKMRKYAPRNDSILKLFLGLSKELSMMIYELNQRNISAISIRHESLLADSLLVKAKLICIVYSTHLHQYYPRINHTTLWVSVHQKIL